MTYDNRSVSPLKIKKGGFLPHNKEGNKKLNLLTEKQIKQMGHDLSDYKVVVTKGGIKLYAKKSDEEKSKGVKPIVGDFHAKKTK
tara:strand:- start:1311 stop:1565 length:255 start_codon:yes stop_codon:yes gene_type:complete